MPFAITVFGMGAIWMMYLVWGRKGFAMGSAIMFFIFFAKAVFSL